MNEILIKCLLGVLSALTGTIVIFFIKLNHHKLCALISFSGGALLSAAIVLFSSGFSADLNFVYLILALLSGYLVFFMIGKYYFHVCPACSASHFDENTTKKFNEIALVMITALSFHSFMDGLAMAVPSGGDHDHSVFGAVLAHKFPEGLALASLLLGSGYKRAKILFIVIAVELTTVVGGFSFYLLDLDQLSRNALILIEAHLAGGFVYLALHAILGEMMRHHKTLVISSFILGIVLILGVNLFFH